MEFRYRYHGHSRVDSNAGKTDLSFAPDSLRPPTHFVGKLRKHIAFREAISALHNVVISDMRFQPKDKEEYKRWLAQEEQNMLAEFMSRKESLQTEIRSLRSELDDLNKQSDKILKPYYDAQRKYFNYLYKHDLDAWYVLDPVITVHPDQVFFECFSEDESSYGKLSCGYEVFETISDTACGTTNIDYSQGLYNEFQKIRDYRETLLQVDPGGFSVQTGDDDQFDEKKIDLPESWVRGFLQVSSAMTLPMVKVELQPMDVHNLCYVLRRKKERVGPRAMRYELEPGKPVRVIFEPWGEEVVCSRSIYQGNEARSIRVWGRRRLHILERLIPVADKFVVHLMGDGMPSFYVAEMGDLTFTLGLSGWSANDWSRMGNFDLMAPRAEVDEITLRRVYHGLQENWLEGSGSLAARLGLDEAVVQSALSIYSQQGQVLFDLADGVYRIRELSREPLPMTQLRFANEREEKADNFNKANLVKLSAVDVNDGVLSLQGEVTDNAVAYRPKVAIDADQRLRQGECQCHFYVHNRLRKGPCEHMLALRKQHQLQHPFILAGAEEAGR
ncbi:SWIM zinc finger family protein [Hahella aquimaris]|uniref:SWIM zinc finger family protein n=1 Tax=Hahella sp. HNIBRBA332 TaxID=3015983 RepID=UPI00273CB4D6|nr:SWIM zinc finger family protein [Hahella sp. HNIBRBA332]WLQ15815.1 SWIM zinc finger family protein [Hahella sp. HNIBRBA332]